MVGEHVQFVLRGGGQPLYLTPGDHEVLGGGDVVPDLPPGEADSRWQVGL